RTACGTTARPTRPTARPCSHPRTSPLPRTSIPAPRTGSGGRVPRRRTGGAAGSGWTARRRSKARTPAGARRAYQAWQRRSSERPAPTVLRSAGRIFRAPLPPRPLRTSLLMKGFTLDRLVAAGVFVVSLVLYLLTVAPTASFWDSGEFIAIAHGLQVSHPPGAPFYMLVGRLFSMVLSPMLAPFVGSASVAVAVNLVSVLSSALTILLTHLVIVRLVRIWQGPPEAWTATDRLAALGGG